MANSVHIRRPKTNRCAQSKREIKSAFSHTHTHAVRKAAQYAHADRPTVGRVGGGRAHTTSGQRAAQQRPADTRKHTQRLAFECAIRYSLRTLSRAHTQLYKCIRSRLFAPATSAHTTFVVCAHLRVRVNSLASERRVLCAQRRRRRRRAMPN